jgi:hypothetical protein
MPERHAEERFETESPGPAQFPWPQLAAMIMGLALVLFGVFGFWPTAFSTFAEGDGGRMFLGIQVSPLRNIIHLVLGVAGLVCATRIPASRTYGWVLAFAGVVMAAFGIVGLLRPQFDMLSMNVPAVVVSAVIALLGLAIALLPVRDAVGEGDPRDGRDAVDRTEAEDPQR